MPDFARRRFVSLAIAGALLTIAPASLVAQAQAATPLKVLFIGNSYTSFNNLPRMIAGLADAAGGRKIETDHHLFGGCTLERHLKEKKAIEKIKSKKWDVVILQEQSLLPVLAPSHMLAAARTLVAEIKQQEAKPVFYLTWARQHIPDMQSGADPEKSPAYAKAMYNISGGAKFAQFEPWVKRSQRGLKSGLNGAYFTAAKETGAVVAPVGIAWKTALNNSPDLVLHKNDKSHPNPAGSYLAACVFYATLLDQNPVGLPGTINQGNKVLADLPAKQAKMLQATAWEVVNNQESTP